MQHPFGQVVELQTHCPLRHFCPAEQAGLLPHLQPPLLQLSAVLESQATQVLPLAPQALKDDV